EIRIELEGLLAPLGAEVDGQAMGSRRELDAVLAEITGDRTVTDVFRRVDRIGRGSGQVSQLRRGYGTARTAGYPDVPRHAGRSRGAHSCAAGARHSVKRIGNLRYTKKVALDVLERRDAHLSVGIVRPHVVDRALGAEHLADGIRGVVVLPSAALDAAAGDIHRQGVGRLGRVCGLILR